MAGSVSGTVRSVPPLPRTMQHAAVAATAPKAAGRPARRRAGRWRRASPSARRAAGRSGSGRSWAATSSRSTSVLAQVLGQAQAAAAAGRSAPSDRRWRTPSASRKRKNWLSVDIRRAAVRGDRPAAAEPGEVAAHGGGVGGFGRKPAAAGVGREVAQVAAVGTPACCGRRRARPPASRGRPRRGGRAAGVRRRCGRRRHRGDAPTGRVRGAGAAAARLVAEPVIRNDLLDMAGRRRQIGEREVGAAADEHEQHRGGGDPQKGLHSERPVPDTIGAKESAGAPVTRACRQRRSREDRSWQEDMTIRSTILCAGPASFNDRAVSSDGSARCRADAPPAPAGDAADRPRRA